MRGGAKWLAKHCTLYNIISRQYKTLCVYFLNLKMVQSCCAYGCAQRFKINSGVRFFRFPIDPELRNKWILAIKRKGWIPGAYARVCSKHFQTGAPKKDPNHPDYVPNVFTFSKKLQSSVKYERRMSSIRKRESALNSKKTDNIDINSSKSPELPIENDSEADVVTENQDATHSGDGNANLELPSENDSDAGVVTENQDATYSGHGNANLDYILLLDAMKENKNLKLLNEQMSIEIQTLRRENSLLLEAMEENKNLKLLNEQMSIEIQTVRSEREALKENIVDLAEDIIQSKEKIKFYTGIDQCVFEWILDVVSTEGKTVQSVSTKIQIFIVFIKLRLNLTIQDLAYRFRISRRTVSRILDNWIPKLASKLGCLIKWPETRAIRKHLPTCFKNSMFKKTIAIIDCTEIPLQRPGNQKARTQTWSTYKHHHTIKFLVAVTPNGLISFVSNVWGGRASDKKITLSSGFMEKLKSGDVILADRGFILEDAFAERGTQLIVPSMLNKRKQLPLTEVIISKNISNVRIHVERVIKLIKRFEVLNSTIPITFAKYINSIVILCAALCNLDNSIVP